MLKEMEKVFLHRLNNSIIGEIGFIVLIWNRFILWSLLKDLNK